MLYSTKSAHIYTKPGKYRISIKKDAIPGNLYNKCKILSNKQPKNIIVKYCIDIPTYVANNTALISNSDKTDIIPDYVAGNYKKIAPSYLSGYTHEFTLPENSCVTKEQFEVMLQDVFNFASLQYKSALNTLKDEVNIGYRIAGDLEEDKNLSNATLDDYLLASNKVIDKEISSIETTLTQRREYAIYSCQKVLSSYQQMLSNNVLTDDKIYDIAKTISSHMFEVNSSSGIKTFTLSAVDFANEKFSNLQFTTNKIELTSLNDLSNINQTLIESIYIPADIEKLPDGFLSNAINLKHIYFNFDSTKPKLKSMNFRKL